MTSKGTNQTLASESMIGKTSLTCSTIQTRAAVTGVLLKINPTNFDTHTNADANINNNNNNNNNSNKNNSISSVSYNNK